MISIWPNMATHTSDYSELSESGHIYHATDIYDALDEEAKDIYFRQLARELYPSGVDAWWYDSCEPVSPEWTHIMEPTPQTAYSEYVEQCSRIMPADMTNTYGLYHARGMYDNWVERDGRRMVNLIRNGYLGSQKYSAVIWSGDISASFKTLKEQIVAGLNFCASGLPYWTFDIGGFFVKRGNPWFWNGEYNEGFEDPEYRELYVRWYQLGVFMPVFRAHGTDFNREPWCIDNNSDTERSPEFLALLAANKLRYRLLPYIYSMAAKVYFDDYTILRMLSFDFPRDENIADINDQYMFGESILVCPVTEPGTKRMSVYLPVGCEWYDYYTNERYSGGQHVRMDITLDRIPLFIKGGSIVPVSEDGEDGRTDIVVYTCRDAQFVLYEDEGDGYGYKEGEYRKTRLVWDEDEWNFRVDEDSDSEQEDKSGKSVIGDVVLVENHRKFTNN